MPVLLPAELWKQSGRYGIEELFKLQGPRRPRPRARDDARGGHRRARGARAALLARPPADLVPHPDEGARRAAARSGGVLRTREFIMKDSYTLDRDVAGLDEGYALHEQAYARIFDRCGLRFYKVESDTGLMGGSGAHEYMAPSPAGEDAVALCDRCDYAANVEMAPQPHLDAGVPAARRRPRRSRRRAPRRSTRSPTFLGIDPRATAKAMPVVADDGTLVLALVRGDRRLHELKLRKALGQEHRPAHARGDRGRVRREARLDRPGGLDGGAMPRSWPTRRWRTAPTSAGANRTGCHITTSCSAATTRRDVADLQRVEAGDGCPQCGGTLRIEPAIEIGNIFKLGTKYSEALGATYLDESGKEQPDRDGLLRHRPGAHRRRGARAVATTSRAASGRRRSPRSTPGSCRSATRRSSAATALEDELAEHGLDGHDRRPAAGPGLEVRGRRPDRRRRCASRSASARSPTGTVDLRLRRDGSEETLPLDQAAARIAELSKGLWPRVSAAPSEPFGSAVARLMRERGLSYRGSRARDRALGRLPQPPGAGHPPGPERRGAGAARGRARRTRRSLHGASPAARRRAARREPELVDRLYTETVQD